MDAERRRGTILDPSGAVQYLGPMSNDMGHEQPQPRGPLTDIRVLELGTLIAGPFAGRWFADFGAEVIKVELPAKGDPLGGGGGP